MTLTLSILALITALSGGYSLYGAAKAMADEIADNSQPMARLFVDALTLVRRGACAVVHLMTGVAFLAYIWI